MIVLDASVLIAHLDANDPHHGQATELLTKHVGEALGVSTITLAETLVGPARAGRLDEAHEAIRELGVQELDLGPEAARRLARLRTETDLKTPDCCVLATAQAHRATVATFDKGLSAVASRA